MKEEHINEIKAIIIGALGIILFVSLFSFVSQDLSWYTSHPNVPAKNLIRITGAYVAGSLFFVFGYSVYALVAFLFFLSWNKFASRELIFSFAKLISFLVLFCVLSSLFSMAGAQESAARFQRAGIVGILISDFLVRYIGTIGAYIILGMLGVMALILTGEFLVSPLFLELAGKVQELVAALYEKFQLHRETVSAGKTGAAAARQPFKGASLKETLRAKAKAKQQEEEEEEEEEYEEDEEEEEEEYEDEEEEEGASKPRIRVIAPKKEAVDEEDEPQIVGEYRLPILDLLQDSPEIPTDKLQNNLINDAQLLETTLMEFGVSARVADIERGPAITRYELEPAPGVKVQKITNLSVRVVLA